MKRLAAVLLLTYGVAFGAEGLSPPPLPPGMTLPTGGSAIAGLPAVLPQPLHMKGGAFDLRFVNVGQLVDLLYGDALHVPHVIDSEVLQDTRLVSFQYDGRSNDLRSFVKTFLDAQGFKVETRDGVDFVSKKAPSETKTPERETLVYHPRYRTAEYLAKAVQPLFSGRFNASTALSLPDSAQSPVGASSVATPSTVAPQSVVSSADELVFSGNASEVRELRRLLPELDRQPGEVVVRGWVYEVTNTTDKNSAFSLVAKLFNGVGGSLSASNGPTDADGTALRFTSNYLNLVISALNSDTRFKQISDPHVRVLSGNRVRLNVGSQVPTLGSISYQGSTSTPVQSVQYQDAGLIFDVRPTVMADAIEVELQEQMSSFVATTTGVNNSPTKNTRQMATTVSMKDGEVIVLGGLVQETNSASVNSPGWLPKFLDGHGSSKGKTEVLLVLQVQRVGEPSLD